MAADYRKAAECLKRITEQENPEIMGSCPFAPGTCHRESDGLKLCPGSGEGPKLLRELEDRLLDNIR